MKYIYLIALMLLLPLTAANGLIVSNSTLVVNKTVFQDSIMMFNLTNSEPYSFYNISIETNLYATTPKISQLDSGQTIQIPLTIISNDNSNVNLKIKGYYISTVGQARDTHEVIVTPYTSSPCSFSITRGDTVKFTSRIVNPIILREHPSNAPVDGGSLTINQSFTKTYDVVGSKTYQWFVGSWGFGELCTLTILPETGYVNDPQLDGLLNLVISNTYKPTNLTSQVFKTDYNIDFFSGDEGTVFITNTGAETAKNIVLSGDWFTFNSNAFDLQPGYSKSITYYVKPVAIITNDTNKSYVKTFTINGNFPTITQNFSVFVKYADITNTATNNSNSNFLNWVCTNYPELCKPQIVYKYITNGTDSMQINITSDQWRDYNLDLQNEKAARQTLYNLIKTKDDAYAASQNISATQVADLNTKLDTMLKDQKDKQDNQRFAWILLISIFIIGGMILVGIMIKNKKHRNAEW